jgi:hypothetical protein
LQARSGTGAASSGSSPWNVANWQAWPQQIAFVVLSTDWAIAVTFDDPTNVYPSPISSAPPASRCWRDRRTSRHGGIEHAHRTAGWRRMMAAQL